MNTTRSFDVSMLLLRLAFGGLMILNHGWRKLGKLTGEGPIKFADPLGLGSELSLWLTVFAEVGCAALITIGLFTRMAAVPAFITMFVAAFVIHGADPFADKEHALLFAVAYLVIYLLGPGRYSIDHLRTEWRLGK